MPLSPLPPSITDRTQRKTQTLSVLEEESGKQQVPWREVMVSAPSGLMAWTLLSVPFRVRKRQDQELGTVVLAEYLKRRLGPAPSSELLGHGVQNWEAPSRNSVVPLPFRRGSAGLTATCSLSWAQLPVEGALSSLAFLSDIPLHTRPPCLVSTGVSFPGVSGELEVWHPTSRFTLGKVSFVEVRGCCELRGRPV